MLMKWIMRDRQRWIICAAGVNALGLFATAGNAQNLIMNGSFEHNSAHGTIYNMSNAEFNATVERATAFGSADEIDLMDPSSVYGLPPIDGLFKLGLHRREPGVGTDAFSFDLSSSIVVGTTYTISFWAHAVLDFSPGLSPIEIGISGSATSFGTSVYTSGSLSARSWSHFTGDFVATVGGDFLTVRPIDREETWAHIDDFSITVVPTPATGILFGLGGLLACRRRHR